MEILRVKGLTKIFGGLTAVADVDFTLDDEEILGIIGPNGAGKTTLLNLITGFLKPNLGTVTFESRDITSASTDEVARRGMVRTFQHVKPFANLTALDNVAMGRLYGASPARSVRQAREEGEDLLHFVGLSEKKDAPASKLTLAERRKLESAGPSARGPACSFSTR